MKLGGRSKKVVQSAPKKSSLNTYYRGSAQPTPSPFKKTPVKKSWRAVFSKTFNYLIISALILCLIYSLVVRPDPKLVISNQTFHQASTYRLAAARAMSSFDDHSKLTFNEPGVISTLQQQFPEITSGSVELPLFGQRPVVRLSIAQPDFVFKSQNQEFTLASNGILTNYINKAGVANLPVINDQSGLAPRFGKAILNTSQVNFINQIVAQLKLAGVPTAYFSLPPLAQEVDLHTKDKSYLVKFYLDGDPFVQTGQFLAARHNFNQAHHDPDQYLDVRVPGKIFYK